MRIPDFDKPLFIWSLSLFFLMFVIQSEASQIALKSGYWEYQQRTVINGVSPLGTSLSGSECLLKEEANRVLDSYVAKFKPGFGGDANCTLSNLKPFSGKVTFSLHCVSEENIVSDHQIQYTHLPSKVNVFAEGVMNVAGSAFATKTTATSTWKRACTKEEKHQAEKIKPADYTSVSDTNKKAMLQIGPQGAGPITDPLIFTQSAIQVLFPKARIVKSQAESYGWVQPIFNVFYPGHHDSVFQIDGRQDTDIAFSVFTRSSAVTGTYGERVGITRLGDVTGKNPHLCSFGENKLNTTLVCLTGDKYRSLYTLPSNILKKYDDVIPQSEIDKAVLSEMRYFLGYPKKVKQVNKKNNPKNIVQLNAGDFHSEFNALKTDKPIVIHFTSTDGSCPHCIKNNSVFRELHKSHAKKYTFAEVIFNPWRSYQNKFKRLRGLPVTQLYLDKTEVAKIVGHKKNLTSVLTNAHQKIEKILSDNYSDVIIQQTHTQSLPKLVSENASNKFLLVHVTSTEKACSACIKNNAFFRYAAREHSGNITFAEMMYNPYVKIKNDAALKQYLDSQKIKINGLPATLLYKNGKSIGMRPGIWTSISDDLNTFSKRK